MPTATLTMETTGVTGDLSQTGGKTGRLSSHHAFTEKFEGH